MSRKSIFKRKKNLYDYKFKSNLVYKFINLLMINGKKNLAHNILYSSIDIIFNKLKKNDINIFIDIINKVKPLVEVKSRKIGGSNYKIPFEINEDRKNTLAMKWIISSSRIRSNSKKMYLKLSDELLDILDNKGLSIKKRDDMHKLAESNKAFAFYNKF